MEGMTMLGYFCLMIVIAFVGYIVVCLVCGRDKNK